MKSLPRPLFSALACLLGYFLLTILMTWPTVLHLTTGIPGDGFDGWQNYWNLWWVKESLLVQGHSPYFTDYLYAPTGVSLLFHTLNIFNGLWTLPLQLNFGVAVAYNSVVLVSFALAGYGAYLLSLYTLTCLDLPAPQHRRWSAFIGGLIFTMSPFHFAHLLGHMQVFSMIWPPFYVLWLLRTLRTFTAKTVGQASCLPYLDRQDACPTEKNVALCSLFLILATLVDWYHTLYLLFFTALACGWTMFKFSKQECQSSTLTGKSKTFALLKKVLNPLILVSAIGLIFIIALSPLLIPMVRESHRPDLQMGLDQNISLSADLLAFITPSEMHPLWGAWAKTFADRFSTTTSERLIFAGFIPLILASFIIITRWRNPIVRFWLMVAGTFLTLALGPYLHIAGNIVMVGQWPLPLPYLLLYYTVPFIGLTRSLSRYDLMIMLAVGVLAAMATSQLKSKIRYILPLLILFEFLPVPYPISKIDTPQFFGDLAHDPTAYTIAELPMNWDRPTPLLHQVTHRKRLLTAYTSRNNPMELAWRTPVFQQWRYLAPDIIDLPLAVIAPTIFEDFNLRYIVLDFWQMPPGAERDKTVYWVKAALPQATPFYHDGRLEVYQSPPKTKTEAYLSLGNGWSDRQETSAVVSRTFAKIGELWLHHAQGQPLKLVITASSPSAQSINLFANSTLLDKFQVESPSTVHTIALPTMTPDLVKLELTAELGMVSVSRISLD